MIRELNLPKKNKRQFKKISTTINISENGPKILSFKQIDIIANRTVDVISSNGLYDVYQQIRELQQLSAEVDKARKEMVRLHNKWKKKYKIIDSKYKGPDGASIFLCGIDTKKQ